MTSVNARSGRFAGSPGHAPKTARGYAAIQSPTDRWWKMLGATTARTSPSASTAARVTSSSRTGECTKSPPPHMRATVMREPTSTP
jgi:hypothetical protein